MGALFVLPEHLLGDSFQIQQHTLVFLVNGKIVTQQWIESKVFVTGEEIS